MRNSLFLVALLACAALPASGCAKHVIRDPGTYQAEVEFLTDGAVETADLLLDEAAALPADADAKCVTLAEPALVMKHRAPYHGSMMLHLGDLGDDPGDPPDVPTADEWCAARPAKSEPPEPEPADEPAPANTTDDGGDL